MHGAAGAKTIPLRSRTWPIRFMKNPLFALIAAVLFLGSTPLFGQRALPPQHLTITGTASVEAPTASEGTKIVETPITAKRIFKALGVNQGTKPDYALIFDQMNRLVVLRGISAAANLPDKVLIDLSSTATEDVEVGSTTTRHRRVLTQNLAAGADAGNTIFAGLAGVARISIHTPPGFPYPGPDHTIFRFTAKGTNTEPNPDNPGAILQFKLTTGAPFSQKP